MEEENWKPNDIDIFVYGRHARTSYVKAIVDKFIVRCAEHDLAVQEFNERWSLYCCEGYRIKIFDIKLERFHSKLSFIQFPFAHSSFDVINTFDISVVRVCFYIDSQEFYVAETDWHMIEEKCAQLAPIEWQNALPSGKEVRKLNSVIGRMQKYWERGYSFLGPPFLAVLDADGNRVRDSRVLLCDLKEYEFESDPEDSEYEPSDPEDVSADAGDTEDDSDSDSDGECSTQGEGGGTRT